MRATAFTRLFGLRYPIMQTPMGSVSPPELVAAVSNAGGMGMLAVAGLPPDMIRVQIRRVRELTTQPFGANLLLPVLQPGQAEACIEERVPLVVDAVHPLPVLAAGGIADGRGLAAALVLGAAGAALGTRFLASVECGAAADYKRRIIGATAADTVHGTLFDFGWPDAPHRVLRNSVVDEWERAGRPPTGQRPDEGEAIGAMDFGNVSMPVPRYAAFPAGAGFRGDVEKTALYAGQSCGLVNDLLPAADIVAQVAQQADGILRGLTPAG